MSDYEKLSRLRHALEDMRRDLSQRLMGEDAGKPDLEILHERISRAIKALSPDG
ncbi:hypothetical protein HCZ30_11965 [Marivivens donghaensis]|uniref:Uncharacterized protein n=1 Tax=Marivivens donghaensis TaxID=1699413 RepID=A0ABX0VZA3_9RHOB|nr:hypothetical protein [Marivivens donghaensis]NIY73144.1 hypothetical protein [Marivivens donghaensis]